MICGVAFWIGVGCQNDLLFPGLLSELAGGLLRNGITAGGVVAILMTVFLEGDGTAPEADRSGTRSCRVAEYQEVFSVPSPPATAGGPTWSTASTPPPRRRC